MTTLLGALVLALWFGAGQAAADGGGSAAQTAGQVAPSGQTADGMGTAYQSGASNGASSIRVLSPGNDGAVTQSNSTTAGALAVNANQASQDTTQSQLGGYGSDQSQIAGQAAKNEQDADADATAVQIAPSNDASSIRVLSPGNGGDVNQSNSATAGAAALNGNETNQNVDQAQGGAGYGSDSTQIAGQAASNDQTADADATAFQVKPSNTASSIRVLSPGNDGDVSQSNSATAVGIAANLNGTDQTTDQSQGGSGHGSDATQVAGQEASNHQDADANATAVQLKPSNTASSIRVLSPGNGGDVSQSNSTTAVAAGLNGNKTDQSIDQSQGGASAPTMLGEKTDRKDPGKGSDSTQIAGQKATNSQTADADATAFQVKPSNTASSIRVLSPGNDGDVTQSNSATAVGIAANGNWTDQSIDQTQGGSYESPCVRCEYPGEKSGHGSDYTQIAGQEASNHQDADANATAVQLKPSNTNESIRVLSPGNDGDVSQSNSTTALAAALNLDKTDQSIDQSQAGTGHGSYLQVAGQGAWSKQDADAGATAVQFGASNENSPIRVGSPGGGGSVEQSNDVTALAVALNLNEVCQRLMQEQTGKGSDALQVAGQGSWDDQRGGAWSRAIQGGKKKHSKR
ncbi:MAG TPA: hypothetical protein VHR46_05920 [Gaiella sp.]|nr:hypothetical protein [Gaiella sp.]